MAKYTKKLEEGKKFLYEEDGIRYYKNNTWIDISNIPKCKDGKYDWGKCDNTIVKFLCIDTYGELKIITSKKTKHKAHQLLIEYNNETFSILHRTIMENGIQNIVFPHGVFVFSIGQKINDEKYNITILDREYRVTESASKKKKNYYHFYKIKCNKCNREYWTSLYQMEYGKGCNFCTGYTHGVVTGFNDITITDPWMIPYFQGGEEEAKLYTHASKKEIYPTCPFCNRVSTKSYRISTIHDHHGFLCACSDKMTYPEKIMASVLDQLNLDYRMHIGVGIFTWAKGIIYDFYIENLSCIIEVHGWQHYEKTTFSFKGGRSLKEEQENDRYKEKIAKENGIKNYIVIDCRLSKLEYIKNSILNSNFLEITGISEDKIDWSECERFALDNMMVKVCDYYNNVSSDLDELCRYFHREKTFIKNALLRGKNCGLCNYKQYCNRKIGNNIPIKCIETKKEYLSATECSRLSIDDFGFKMCNTKISQSARDGISYKGYHFCVIDKEKYFEEHNLYK